MQRRKIFSFGVLMLVAGLFFTTSASVNAATNTSTASEATSTRPYVRIFYYRDNKNALASLAQNYKSIDVLAPQSYSIDAEGNLSGKISKFVIELAGIHGIRIMPLVTNKSFNKDRAHNFLDSDAAQESAIAALIKEAQRYGYIGWQIDFEQMDASYRDKFSAFVKKAANQLRENNLTLSVAVVAQISETPADYPKTLWQDIIGVYDYAALGKNADFVSVMSYDDPGSKGPVARLSWMSDVLKFTMTKMPAEKISLGLPLYYWVWNQTTGKLVDIGGYSSILKAYEKHYISKIFSKDEKMFYLAWSGYGSSYKLWYDNDVSMAPKLSLVTDNHLHGFSAWALGLEVPSVHEVFQSKKMLAGVAASI